MEIQQCYVTTRNECRYCQEAHLITRYRYPRLGQSFFPITILQSFLIPRQIGLTSSDFVPRPRQPRIMVLRLSLIWRPSLSSTKIPRICWCRVQEDVINFRRDFVLSLYAARRSVESSLEMISTASIILTMKLKYPPLKEPSYMQWDIGGPPLTSSSLCENSVLRVDGGYPIRLALINHTQVSENNEVLTSKWKALGTQCRTPWKSSMKLSLCWPRYPELGSEYRELAANETALFNS